jgi:cytochrome c oxidase subunit 3
MSAVTSHRQGQLRDESTAYVGMVIFLASWAVLFIALFFAYGLLRARAMQWPPEDLPRPPFFLPAINTLVILGSSLTLQSALSGLRRGKELRLARTVGLSALLGAVFLALQTVVWVRLYAGGLLPSAGAYASVFYMLTVVHALHVLVGLVALAWLSLRALRGTYSTARHLAVRLWTMYWHFVGVIWGFLFLLVYLV